MTDSDGNIYLTVDSLREENNTITGSNNITLRKINVKPYGLGKMYMDKDIIKDKVNRSIQRKENYNRKFFFSISK